jgi:hypothetical protein
MRTVTLLLILASLIGLAVVGTSPAQSLSRQSLTSDGDTQVQQTGALFATVLTDKPEYALGEPVQLTLRVRNASPFTVTVTMPTGQDFDFIVRTLAGPEVWRWSHDQAFTQAVREVTFAPGETKTFTASWDQRDNDGQPVGPGFYAVTGVFTSSPPVRSASRVFAIRSTAATPTATATATPPPGTLVASVATDKSTYALGEPVQFTLQVRNTASAAVTVTLPTGQDYDFIVRAADGTEVWRWSHDQAFTQVVRQATFGPGETKTFTTTWDQRNNDGQPVGAGQFTVTGVYTGSPPVQSAPRPFTIGPGSPTPTATVPPEQARWLDRPPASAGATPACPSSGQWLLLYWGGADGTPIAAAADRCTDADVFWVSRSGRWLGYSKTATAASDVWNVLRGEAHFAHGG